MIKYSLIAVLFGVICADHEYTCEWSSDYVTMFDGQGKAFLSGQYSYKSNENSTRLYKWKTCNINIEQETQIELPKTWKDDPILILGCGGNTALNYINIVDDMFDVKCASLNDEYILDQCEWTPLLNDKHDILKYQCRNNGLIRTIYTQYDVYKNDRQYKFECCNVEENIHNIANMSCYQDRNWRNNHNKPVNYNARNVILNGIKSEHNIRYGDRIFKFNKCQPKNDDYSNMITSIKHLDKSRWETTWDKSCKDINNGNAVMTGIETNHDKYKQDNQFKFTCASLNNNKYGLINCGYTGYINNWESDMDFNCPDNGLIRGISTIYRDGFGDRRYLIECCQLATNILSEPKGEWVPLQTCYNCDSTSYNYVTGLMSKIDSTTDEYINHLIDVVSNGYEYNGILSKDANNKIVISSDMAIHTLNELNKDLNQAQMKEVSSFECDKDYVFQWRQSIKNTLPNVGNHDVFIYSSSLLCTNEIPQCPLGFCVNNDCTSCKNGYTFDNTNIETNNIMPIYTNNDDTVVTNADNNKISTLPDSRPHNNNKPNSGIYFDGVNITTVIIYTIIGVITTILCCGVFIFGFKLCKQVNNKYKYDPLKVINNLSDTTDVTSDAPTDINV